MSYEVPNIQTHRQTHTQTDKGKQPRNQVRKGHDLSIENNVLCGLLDAIICFNIKKYENYTQIDHK